MTQYLLDHNLLGLTIGLLTFLVIGLFHPLVIKGEYYFGTSIWQVFFIAGLLFGAGAVLVDNVLLSALFGVTSFSSFWSILEVFQQRERVRKGWFPSNPARESREKARHSKKLREKERI